MTTTQIERAELLTAVKDQCTSKRIKLLRRVLMDLDIAEARAHDWVADVVEFHRTFDHPIRPTPGFPSKGRVGFRYQFLREEMFELSEGIAWRDIVEVADALADITYVAIGMAIEFGIDLRPVWDAVHQANMAKKGGAIRGDGKQLKPKGWKPPDIVGAIEKGRLE